MPHSNFNARESIARLIEREFRFGLHLVMQHGSATLGSATATAMTLLAACAMLGAGYLAIAPVVGPAGVLAISGGAGLGLSYPA